MMNDLAHDGPPGRRPRVLLVEDDTAVRRSLQLLLQARGYEVRAYASGTALLADRTATDAACLVADYCMQDCDGVETLAQLRRQGWNGPAILITAFASSGRAQTALGAGFDMILDKPLRQHALGAAVDRLIAAASG